MSRGNGKGPNELGPMTGKRRGYCMGYNDSGLSEFPNENFGFAGRGRGAGFANGNGRRNEFRRGFRGGFQNANRGRSFIPVQLTAEQELTSLQQDADYLKQNLDSINKRIAELNTDNDT